VPNTKESGIAEAILRVQGEQNMPSVYMTPFTSADLAALAHAYLALREALVKCWQHGQTYGEIRRIVEDALGERPE
jgi:hypothetical protein